MVGQRQFDEKQALESVRDVFWHKGYGATSMQDLAAASGVLRGSLYNAYGDKEALFLRVYADYADQFLADAAAALTHPRVDQALRDFFDFTITSMTTGVPTRGCLTTKTAIDTKADGERIRAAVRGLLDDMERLLERRLSADDARPRLAVPPAEAARVLITMTRGIVVMERVYQDAERLRATAAALIDALVPDMG
ncbi:TetR/AcrR family transcriptional regulator [Planotetraspora kaengkrachanensis]|uniref:TetR family transcriptional regulator n=1 Tax=Planotetraspora kaengkrachanensis TaxID=575193 RepID=A0A8J3LSN3_9ACTN|nr:TetR/AcrR family transcriptional regulator [Planotetraspora kaengkrachanensis]GIG78398.1 TetR family transcriptional regulator [Planotetraspora kaengkrachanensis]